MTGPAPLSALKLGGQTVAITLDHGRISAITPVDGPAKAVVLPLTVDAHVHLDKTFTIHRCRPAEPGLFAAIEAIHADALHWTVADLRTRISLALAEAAQHGIRAMRSHVDWVEPGAAPLAWEVLGDMAQEWAGRIHLQRAALVPLDLLGDPDLGPPIAAQVAQAGGVLGCFVYRNSDQPAKLARVFALADRHGLRLDFHVDEGIEPEAMGFDTIVALTVAHGMAGRVLCGHACSLSVRPAAEVQALLEAAAKAGLALTVMPTTNMHLQDNHPGRTPRLRGVAPLHEGRRAGLPMLLGADNVADPFYPYGCYDQIEVLRLASLVCHLNPEDWLDAITTTPARAMGLEPGRLAAGEPADLIVIEGADWTGALRTPNARRWVFRNGATG